jgi:hypothetical protein
VGSRCGKQEQDISEKKVKEAGVYIYGMVSGRGCEEVVRNVGFFYRAERGVGLGLLNEVAAGFVPLCRDSYSIHKGITYEL